jgi:hypothetical protein
MNAEPRRIAELKSHLIFGTQNEKKTILEEMPNVSCLLSLHPEIEKHFSLTEIILSKNTYKAEIYFFLYKWIKIKTTYKTSSY